MLRNGWVSFALYFAVSALSVAEEKKGDSYARIDTHPTCTRIPPLGFENLVVNCGFETGTFEGWDQSGDLSNTEVNGDAAHSGDFGAMFSPPTLGFIAQTLQTVPDQTYMISFWVQNFGQPNEFQLYWDGNLVSDLVNVLDTRYEQWWLRTRIVATSEMTEIKFGFSNPTGFFYLDDVVVEEAF